MESDVELMAMYPSKPPKLIKLWNDARAHVVYAGERFVAAGRVNGSPEDQELADAEAREQEYWDRLFRPRRWC